MHGGQNCIDLTGQTFGRWLVQSKSQQRDGRAYWNCVCVCGTSRKVASRGLRSGESRSCGCLNNELVVVNTAKFKFKHGHALGHTMTRTYSSWVSMRRRCLNPTDKDFARYGGRGITICERWTTYENFLADMGERPEGKTLDRYPDKNGNYENGNVRWATPEEQANNRRPRRLAA
jgi:hypothetical protein